MLNIQQQQQHISQTLPRKHDSTLLRSQNTSQPNRQFVIGCMLTFFPNSREIRDWPSGACHSLSGPLAAQARPALLLHDFCTGQRSVLRTCRDGSCHLCRRENSSLSSHSTCIIGKVLVCEKEAARITCEWRKAKASEFLPFLRAEPRTRLYRAPLWTWVWRVGESKKGRAFVPNILRKG